MESTVPDPEQMVPADELTASQGASPSEPDVGEEITQEEEVEVEVAEQERIVVQSTNPDSVPPTFQDPPLDRSADRTSSLTPQIIGDAPAVSLANQYHSELQVAGLASQNAVQAQQQLMTMQQVAMLQNLCLLTPPQYSPLTLLQRGVQSLSQAKIQLLDILSQTDPREE